MKMYQRTVTILKWKSGLLLGQALIVVLLAGTLPLSVRADVPAILGGGNITRNLSKAEVQLEALRAVGVGMCRIPVSPNDYGLDTGEPHPERLDDVIVLAHQQNIEPILLFEYYTRWHPSLYDRARWFAIGQAYAERFQPNSDWLKSKGIRDWGVRFYSAINEPTWKSNNPTPIPAKDYVEALEGLADGVHRVNDTLKVNPGGWIEGSLRHRQHVYSKAVAPLFNRGKLHAVGIHRYWDIDYIPMKDRYDWSLQSQFDEVKRKAGITADVAFYTDEVNVKKREITEEEAARDFLTALWDALAVVGNDGERVTEFVMPWNIFHLTSSDTHYGLCTKQTPWTPVARGKVLKLVCDLTEGMEFASCDPKGKGEFVLEGPGQKLWVWQNRKAWTNHPGTTFTVRDIPSGAAALSVYGWDGQRRTIKLTGKPAAEVQDLKQGETYMFAVTFPLTIRFEKPLTPRQTEQCKKTENPIHAQDGQPIVVAVSDSLTNNGPTNWLAVLGDMRPDIHTVAEAHGGWTTKSYFKAKFDGMAWAALPERADVAIILMGSNNLFEDRGGSNASVQEAVDGVQKIEAHLRGKYPHVKIILAAPPTCVPQRWTDRTSDRRIDDHSPKCLGRLSEEYRRLAGRRGWGFVDLYRLLEAPDDFSDAAHPAAQANREIAAAMVNAVNELLATGTRNAVKPSAKSFITRERSKRCFQVRSTTMKALGFGGLIAVVVLASSASSKDPWPKEIAGHVALQPGEHPRLFFRKGDLDNLREKAKTPEGQAILKRLRVTLNGGDGRSMPENLGVKGQVNQDGSGEFAKDAAGKTYTISHVAGYGFLYQITGEKKYADLGREAMDAALEGFRGRDRRYSFKHPYGALRAGPSLGWYAVGYDLCYDGWDEAYRRKIAKAICDYNEGTFMSLEELVNGKRHFPASNHWGMQVGGGSLALTAITGDPGVDQPKIDKLLDNSQKAMIRNVTKGFGDGGYFAEGDGVSGAGYFSIGYESVLPEQRAGIWWWYHRYVKDWDEENGTPWDTLSPYPHHSILALVNTPLDLDPVNPVECIPRCVRDTTHGFYGFRNRWQDENDIVITQLTRRSPARFKHGPDRSMTIQHHGKKESWGPIPATASHWQPAADGSAIIGDGKTCLAIDFSGASGADGMLVMTGPGSDQGETVEAGGRTYSLKFLHDGPEPTPRVEGDKVVVGKQTVTMQDGKLVLGTFADE